MSKPFTNSYSSIIVILIYCLQYFTQKLRQKKRDKDRGIGRQTETEKQMDTDKQSNVLFFTLCPTMIYKILYIIYENQDRKKFTIQFSSSSEDNGTALENNQEQQDKDRTLVLIP